MNKKVSIIIPIYNAQPYLVKCLDSLQAQTYKNLEMILINDGSIDNSAKICDDYSSKDSRFIVLHMENNGVSNARNQGLNLVSGDYITFVDADDYVEPSYIAQQVMTLEKNRVDIAICGFYIDKDRKSEQSDWEDVKKVITHPDLLSSIAKDNKIGGFLWNKLFKTQVIRKYRFPSDIKLCEDVYFLCSLLKKSTTIFYNSQPLYHYVQHENSATNNKENIFNCHMESEYNIALLRIIEDDILFDTSLQKWIYVCVIRICIGTLKDARENKFYNKGIIIKNTKMTYKKYAKYYYKNKKISVKDKLKTLLNYYFSIGYFKHKVVNYLKKRAK